MLQVNTRNVSKILPLAIIALFVITLIPTNIEAETYGSQPTAMITFSSDDGMIGIYNNKDLFINRGIPLTCFIITSAVGLADRVTWEQLRELEEAGWEIGSHSRDHNYLTTVNSSVLYNEVAGSYSDLVAQGFNVRSFAYPYADANNTVTNLVHQYYTAVRDVGTETTYEAASAEWVTLGMQDYTAMPIVNDLAQLMGFIDTAIANGDWLNFYFHNITADGKLSASSTFYMYELLDYVEDKVGDGVLQATNFYEGHKKLSTSIKDVDMSVLLTSGLPSCIDLTEDLIANPELVFKGITLNNTLANPSFETYAGGSFTGWTTGSGIVTKTQISSDKVIGSYAAELKYDGTAPAYTWSLYQDIYTTTSDISPGDKIEAFMYLKKITNVTKFDLYFEFYTDGGALIERRGDMDVTASTSWTVHDTGIVTQWLTVPVNAYKIRLRLDIDSMSAGATDATYRIDGAVLMKLPSQITDYVLAGNEPPYFTVPPLSFVGMVKTTNPTVLANGVAYSYSGTLGDGDEIRFNLTTGAPYGGFLDLVPSIGGHGVMLISVEGERVASVINGKIGASTVSDEHIRVYNYTATTSIVTWNATTVKLDSPVSVDGYSQLDDGQYYVTNGENSYGPFDSVNGWAIIELYPGTNEIITETQYRQDQMDSAISPIFAIIPIVIIVGLIPMVMGFGRKLK